MSGMRRCGRCDVEFDGGPSVSASCPKCGTMIFDDESRPTLIPEAYGPGEILARLERPKAAPETPVDASAPTVTLGASDVVVPSDMHFPPVQRVAHYDVLGEIARGGMGVVYRARDTKLNRLVALKVLLEGEHASPESVERFLREAQSTARLRHPSIVPIYDLGVNNGHNFLVMEYIVGQPLSALVRAREMTPSRAVEVMLQVADAVEHAHREGIVHRDLKPANILVDTEWRAKVTDFGLAKAAKGGGDLTKSGTAMGTPYYMPPEQARGDMRLVDQRSDVYSMGAVLYECLAGVPPFVGENDIDTIIKVVNEDPIPPGKNGRDVPADLEHVCLKALEKEPARRYQSAREFADELRRYRSGEGVLARGTGPVSRVLRHARRHRALIAAGFVGFAAAVSLFGMIRLGNTAKLKRAPKPPPAVVAAEPAIPVYEERGGTWAGEGWRLGTDGQSDIWEVAAGPERRLVAAGLHDGALRLSFTLAFDPAGPATVAVRLFANPAFPEEGYLVRLSRAGRGLKIEAERPGGAMPRREFARVPMGPAWMPVMIERRVDGLWIWAGGNPVPALELFDPGPGFRRESREVSIAAYGGSVRVGGLHLEEESAPYRRHPVGVGDRMFDLQAWDVAEEQYRFAAPVSPRAAIDWEALYRAGLCRLQLAEAGAGVEGYRAAAEAFARVLREDPHGTAARGARHALPLAVAHLDNADAYADILPPASAVAAAQQQSRVADYPGGAEVDERNAWRQLLDLGRILGDDGDPEKAAKRYMESYERCQSRPDLHCAQALSRLADTYYRRGLYGDCERTCREELKLLDELSRKQRESGIRDLVLGKNRSKVPEEEVDALLARFGTPMAVYEMQRRAREILARSAACAGRPDEAVALLDAWLAEAEKETLNTRAPLLMVKADVLRAAGRLQEAEGLYAKLSEVGNELFAVPASRELVRTRLAAGDVKGAEAALEEAAARRPRNTAAFEYDRGLLDVFAGRTDEARAHFERAATDAEGEDVLRIVCWYLLGRLPRRTLEVTLQVSGTSPAHLEYLTGLAAEAAGKPKEALAAYRAAEELCYGHETPWMLVRARRLALERE